MDKMGMMLAVQKDTSRVSMMVVPMVPSLADSMVA